jgi:beta-lactamase regulating signal transducer with metallopeptidase domain
VSIMTVVETILGYPASQAIGWAVLHFVWQGTLVGLLAGGALGLLRRSAADVRYVVSSIALSLMFTMPVVTGVQTWRAAMNGPHNARAATSCGGATPCERQAGEAIDLSADEIVRTVEATAAATGHRAGARSQGGMNFAPLSESWLPMLVLAWLCGVGALTLRLFATWLWVQRMKTYRTAPVAESLQRIAAGLARRLHIARPVRFLQSALVEVPTVIGCLKPVVLLPASTLAGLAPAQLEAILAHELAHIRRHDYLVNLLQTVVETLLFYHPAVWWLSRRIRIERENCCDDLAVSLCGDPITYAQALADLEELRGTGGPLVLAASGGSLVQRIGRLLGAPADAGRATGWLAGSVAVLLMSGIVAGAAGVDAFQWGPTAVVATASQPNAASNVEPVLATTVSRAAAVSVPSPERPLPTPPPASSPRLRAPDAASGAPTPEPRVPSPEIRAPAAERAASAGAPGRQTHRSFSWSNNGERLEVKYDGEAEFTDDDTDVKRLSPGGLLRIKDGWLFPSHTVEFSLDGEGNIRRRFWAGMSERPFDPEGRQWIAAMLPRFIRQTGIGAPARVARILKAKGPAGVLQEIALIEGSYGKKLYFSELLKAPSLDPVGVRQVLAQAGREIDSDFELASLLIDSADRLMVDDQSRQAYFEASRSIDSDFEMRRVYSSALKRGSLAPAALGALLSASSKIESDFEQASLLIDVARSQALDGTTRPLFFSALGTVDSDFEHRRVLGALAARQNLAPETTAAMLGSAASVSSDFEAASFLVDVASHQPIEGLLRVPFFRAIDSIGSSFERARVLDVVAARPDASQETIVSALRAAASMDSGFERSKVLLTVAQSHRLEGSARDAYIDAAEKLGEFEQGKVLAALVRSERRK